MKLTLLILLLFPLVIFGQGLEQFTCNVIEAFKKQDSVAFAGFPIQPTDFKYLIKQTTNVPFENDDKSSDKNEDAVNEFKKQLYQSFKTFYQRSLLMGVIWNDVNCSDYTLKIEDDEAGFKVVSISIILNKEETRELILTKMIQINGNWRIREIDLR